MADDSLVGADLDVIIAEAKGWKLVKRMLRVM